MFSASVFLFRDGKHHLWSIYFCIFSRELEYIDPCCGLIFHRQHPRVWMWSLPGKWMHCELGKETVNENTAGNLFFHTNIEKVLLRVKPGIGPEKGATKHFIWKVLKSKISFWSCRYFGKLRTTFATHNFPDHLSWPEKPSTPVDRGTQHYATFRLISAAQRRKILLCQILNFNRRQYGSGVLLLLAC